MKSFETTATVEDQGQLRLAGVPFAAGTQVEVRIRPKAPTTDSPETPQEEALIAARQRMREMFATIKGFRNTPRIPREELHDRGSVY